MTCLESGGQIDTRIFAQVLAASMSYQCRRILEVSVSALTSQRAFGL